MPDCGWHLFPGAIALMTPGLPGYKQHDVTIKYRFCLAAASIGADAFADIVEPGVCLGLRGLAVLGGISFHRRFQQPFAPTILP